MSVEFSVKKDNILYRYVRSRVLLTVTLPDGEERYYEDYRIPPFFDCGIEFIERVEKEGVNYNEEKQYRRARHWRKLCRLKSGVENK